MADQASPKKPAAPLALTPAELLAEVGTLGRRISDTRDGPCFHLCRLRLFHTDFKRGCGNIGTTIEAARCELRD